MVTAPIQNPSANQKDKDLDNLKCLNRTLAKITAVNSINVTQKQFEIYESNFLLDVIKREDIRPIGNPAKTAAKPGLTSSAKYLTRAIVPPPTKKGTKNLLPKDSTDDDIVLQYIL